MICNVCHTDFQPAENEWKCPECGSGNDYFYVYESPPESADACELLHDYDYVVCDQCKSQWDGADVAKLIQRKVDDRGLESVLVSTIREYYDKRSLVWPQNVWEALGWAISELGEAYELLNARQRNWIRNNPEECPEFTPELLAEELGDAIVMIVVAGIVEGVDPIQALYDKMQRKLDAC